MIFVSLSFFFSFVFHDHDIVDLLISLVIGGIAYWLIGFPLAFGSKGNFFLSYNYWANYQLPTEKYGHWFFDFVHAATASTLVSGSMAERCNFYAYLVYSFLITGLYSPIQNAFDSDVLSCDERYSYEILRKTRRKRVKISKWTSKNKSAAKISKIKSMRVKVAINHLKILILKVLSKASSARSYYLIAFLWKKIQLKYETK